MVGHDWGGMLAWGAAMLHPECVDRSAILNAPHPAHTCARLPETRARCCFLVHRAVPGAGLAERLLTCGHGRGVADLLLGSTVEPECFWPDHLPAVPPGDAAAGAARATLAYYRALVATPLSRSGLDLRPVRPRPC